MTDTKENNTKKNTGSHSSDFILAGLIASAVAGVIYLYDRNRQATEKQIRGWVLKAKGEIMDQVAQAETLTREGYERIVDEAVDRYADKQSELSANVQDVRNRLKSRWSEISHNIESHLAEVQEAGSHVVESAVAQAITSAAEELAAQKENEDIDSLEILQTAAQSGASEATQKIKAAVSPASKSEDS